MSVKAKRSSLKALNEAGLQRWVPSTYGEQLTAACKSSFREANVSSS